jgi:hypothetical protein
MPRRGRMRFLTPPSLTREARSTRREFRTPKAQLPPKPPSDLGSMIGNNSIVHHVERLLQHRARAGDPTGREALPFEENARRSGRPPSRCWAVRAPAHPPNALVTQTVSCALDCLSTSLDVRIKRPGTHPRSHAPRGNAVPDALCRPSCGGPRSGQEGIPMRSVGTRTEEKGDWLPAPWGP